ncbi:hypothetical protein Golob_019261 [Gossypium lobatum]|uniref:Uncharacterized protein n=1 Tax=Gossypium lobatum TaxID=34289 RepID=A0A7J8L6W0_9ROSI|nr:hypothetical protein [Gossypium lobatum]
MSFVQENEALSNRSLTKHLSSLEWRALENHVVHINFDAAFSQHFLDLLRGWWLGMKGGDSLQIDSGKSDILFICCGSFCMLSSSEGSGATYEDQLPHLGGPRKQWRFFTVYDVIGDAICFVLFQGKPLIEPSTWMASVEALPMWVLDGQ